MTGFAFHPEAEADMNDIWEYIAANNSAAADRVTAEIESALSSLLLFPGRGHSRSDLTSRPLRFILVREYLIAYAPDENPLWVVAIIHGRRNPRVMAAILRSRE